MADVANKFPVFVLSPDSIRLLLKSIVDSRRSPCGAVLPTMPGHIFAWQRSSFNWADTVNCKRWKHCHYVYPQFAPETSTGLLHGQSQ